MAKPTPDAEEFLQQKHHLFSPPGALGSGYARYSAAMYFHKLGLVSVELLEIYRRCCKFDHEDPVELAVHEGIAVLDKDQFYELSVQA